MNLKFMGQLRDGKKNGNGKQMHENGTVYCDGFFQNDFPHGDKVKLMHDNKKVMYEGGMHEGQKQGTGTEYYANGQILFSGAWNNNEPDGKGIKIYNEDGSVMFEGDKGVEAEPKPEEQQTQEDGMVGVALTWGFMKATARNLKWLEDAKANKGKTPENDTPTEGMLETGDPWSFLRPTAGNLKWMQEHKAQVDAAKAK